MVDVVHDLRLSALAQRRLVPTLPPPLYASDLRVHQLTGIMRTVYNQYESLVRPLQAWLNERGVQTKLDMRVTDLIFRKKGDTKSARHILCRHGGHSCEITVGPEDYVTSPSAR